jgi:hypothetical protein
VIGGMYKDMRMGGSIHVIVYVPSQENGWSYTRDRGYVPSQENGSSHTRDRGYVPSQENGWSYARDRGYVPSQENGWSYTRDRGMYQVRRVGGRMYVPLSRAYDHPFSWFCTYPCHVHTTTHSPGLVHTPITYIRPPILLTWYIPLSRVYDHPYQVRRMGGRMYVIGVCTKP